MTKIKYGQKINPFTDDYPEEVLYKRGIWLPGFVTVSWLVTVALTITAFSLYTVELDNDGAPGFGFVATIMFSVSCLATMWGCIEVADPRVVVFKHLFKTTKLPPSFDPNLINHPYYQQALQEHWEGKDIGSMKPLNQQLYNQTESVIKSDIVSRLAALAKDEKEFMKLIEGTK